MGTKAVMFCVELMSGNIPLPRYANKIPPHHMSAFGDVDGVLRDPINTRYARPP